jgi:hypothetical protein
MRKVPMPTGFGPASEPEPTRIIRRRRSRLGPRGPRVPAGVPQPAFEVDLRERPAPALDRLRAVADVPETRYAKTADGAYVAYQVVGDGPDLVFMETLGTHIELAWEVAGFALWAITVRRDL